MLEEVLLKRVSDIKYLSKKSNYALEKWEKLFAYIRRLSVTEENNNNPLPQLIADILGIIYGANIHTAIVLSEGEDQDGIEQDFMLIKGIKQNTMALISDTMYKDEDFQQIVLAGIYGFDKLRDRDKAQSNQTKSGHRLPGSEIPGSHQ